MLSSRRISPAHIQYVVLRFASYLRVRKQIAKHTQAAKRTCAPRWRDKGTVTTQACIQHHILRLKQPACLLPMSDVAVGLATIRETKQGSRVPLTPLAPARSNARLLKELGPKCR